MPLVAVLVLGACDSLRDTRMPPDSDSTCAGYRLQLDQGASTIPSEERCYWARRAVAMVRDSFSRLVEMSFDSLRIDSTIGLGSEPMRMWPGGPQNSSLGSNRVITIHFNALGYRRNPVVAFDRADSSALLAVVHPLARLERGLTSGWNCRCARRSGILPLSIRCAPPAPAGGRGSPRLAALPGAVPSESLN
jgi:hypothetical protein